MSKKLSQNKKILLKIGYHKAKLSKFKKKESLKLNPILSISLYLMFGRSMKHCFGEKLRFN